MLLFIVYFSRNQFKTAVTVCFGTICFSKIIKKGSSPIRNQNFSSPQDQENNTVTVQPPLTTDELLDKPFEDLINRLNSSSNGLTSEEAENLHHLRRTGLISIDWHKRTIKRQGTMRGYVTKYVETHAIWPMESIRAPSIPALIGSP